MGLWFDLAEPEPAPDPATDREVRPWAALGCVELGRRTARFVGRPPADDDPVGVFLARGDVLVGLRVLATEPVVTLRTLLADGSLVETVAGPETYWRSGDEQVATSAENRSVEARRGLSASEALRDHERHVDRVAAERGTARVVRAATLPEVVDLWHRAADHDAQLAVHQAGVDPNPAMRRVLLALAAFPLVLAVDLLLLGAGMPLLLVAAVALVLVTVADQLLVRRMARRTVPPEFPLLPGPTFPAG